MDCKIGKLIKNARLMRGVSMEGLCVMLDKRVTKQTISNYERGVSKPSAEFLKMLIKVMNLPDGYFVEPKMEIQNIQLRMDGNMNTKDFRRLEAVIKEELTQYLSLEKQLCIVPQTYINPIRDIEIVDMKNDINRAVDLLRREWGLGSYSIPYLCDVIESAGIIVLLIDCDVEGFSGLCGYTESLGRPFIAVNKNMTIERIRFTIAHELGHLLLFLSGMIENKEKACNYFAGTLMLSTKAVEKEFGLYRKSLSLDELISVKERYGASVASIVHRLYDLNVISRKYYDHLYDDVINKNKMEEGWGGYPIDDRPQYYKQMCRRAITLGVKIEEYCCKPEIIIL